MVAGPPPYSPGAIPVDHFCGFFFGRITFTGLRPAASVVAAVAGAGTASPDEAAEAHSGRTAAARVEEATASSDMARRRWLRSQSLGKYLGGGRAERGSRRRGGEADQWQPRE